MISPLAGTALFCLSCVIWVTLGLFALYIRRRLWAIVYNLEKFARPVETGQGTLLDRLIASTASMQTRIIALGHREARQHGVTDLPTREVLLDQIDDDLNSPGLPCGLLGIVDLIDYDRLSSFDSRQAQDVLKTFADRLARMVGPDRTVAHIDRARFAMWFGQTEKSKALAEFDAVCYALGGEIIAPGVDLVPQILSGRAYREAGESERAGALLMRAQAASLLVRAGEQPDDAATDVIGIARFRFELEQDLRHAIDRRQFEMRFQPFVDAERQCVTGAEALIRWNHPVRGVVSPALFMPVVEAAEMSDEIGMWVMNSACDAARAWSAAGLDLKVAINISAQQLHRDTLDTAVARMLQRHGLPAGILELELTESIAATDSATAAQLFRKLRSLGVSISIDDFGAGYSSLSYLKRLSFDKLKIDREFVAEVDCHRDSQAICQSIIALGRGLGIAVLAEGVERREEYSWLRRHGCTLFQGYYFAQPMESSALVDFACDRPTLAALTDLSPSALQKRVADAVA